MRFVNTFAALALASSVSAGPCKPGSSSTLSATTSSASPTSTSGHSSGPIVNEIEGGDFRRRSNSPSGISNFVVEGQGSHVEGGGYTGGGSTEKNCASLEAASTQPGPGKRDVGQYAAISQQLTNLQAGSAYTVQFFYAVQSSAQSGACRIEASFGSNVFTSTPYFPSSNTPSSWASSTVSTNIQVTQGQMSFALTCTGGGSAQVYIDSIFVSNQVTPETIGDADLVFDGDSAETSQVPSATSTEAATEATTETEAATETTTDATSVASSDAGSSDSATEATTEASTETITEEGNTSETTPASETTSEEQGTSTTKSATESATETVSGEGTSAASTASETTAEETTSAAATSTETSAGEETTAEETTSAAATSTETSAGEETTSTTEAEETTTAQQTTFSTSTLETTTQVEEITSETLIPTSTTPTSTQLYCPSGVSAPGGCYIPSEVPGTPTCFQVGFVSGVVDVQYQDMKTPVQDWETCASACADKTGCLSFGYDAENPNRYCALYASKLDWSFSPMSQGLTWTEMDCIKCVECEDAPIPTETGVAEAGDPPVEGETTATVGMPS